MVGVTILTEIRNSRTENYQKMTRREYAMPTQGDSIRYNSLNDRQLNQDMSLKITLRSGVIVGFPLRNANHVFSRKMTTQTGEFKETGGKTRGD